MATACIDWWKCLWEIRGNRKSMWLIDRLIAIISAKFWKRLSIQKTSWAVSSPVHDLGFPQRCWWRFKVPWDVTLCRWASSAGTFVVQQYRKEMKAFWSLETPTKRHINEPFTSNCSRSTAEQIHLILRTPNIFYRVNKILQYFWGKLIQSKTSLRLPLSYILILLSHLSPGFLSD
jgi:hypothetical protein